MRNSLIIALVFLLSMVCHAQKIATSELNGTKWKLVSPVSDYCERGMSFTMTTRTTTTKFKKNKKEFLFPLKYYLSSSIPKTFDSSQIGKRRKGSYIIQYVDNSVFWFKIVDISSTKITLLSKLGDTTVYQKVK
uniref:hypothetical protein n=1 Tax=Segatella hominis TaxID=2518605 RepID=UPI0040260E65